MVVTGYVLAGLAVVLSAAGATFGASFWTRTGAVLLVAAVWLFLAAGALWYFADRRQARPDRGRERAARVVRGVVETSSDLPARSAEGPRKVRAGRTARVTRRSRRAG